MKNWNAREYLAFFDLFTKKGLNYYEISSFKAIKNAALIIYLLYAERAGEQQY